LHRYSVFSPGPDAFQLCCGFAAILISTSVRPVYTFAELSIDIPENNIDGSDASDDVGQ